MKIVRAILLLIVIPVSIFSAQLCIADSFKEITIDVRQLIPLLEDNLGTVVGTSFQQKRVCFGFYKDPSCPIFASFALESENWGNSSKQYLAVFLPAGDFENQKQKSYRLDTVMLIGQRGVGYFDIDSAKTDGNTVIISGKGYRSSDALCCPSKPMKLKLTLDQYGFIKLSTP